MIWCWIRGMPFESWSPVSAPLEITVAEFKKLAIGERKSLQALIYKAPIENPDGDVTAPKPVLDNDETEATLGGLSIFVLGRPLRAMTTLSTIFKSPIPQNQLHFIVDASFEVRCWRRGAEDVESCSFDVVASAVETVDKFRDRVREYRTLADVSNEVLEVYKVSTGNDVDLAEVIDTKKEGQLLDGGQTMGSVFGDVSFSQPLRVVIEVRDKKDSKPPPSAKRPVTQHEDPLIDARLRFLEGIPKKAPSSAGVPSFRKQQGGDWFIPCGRYCENSDKEETIPPTLFHLVFGQFVHDCQNIVPEVGDYLLARDLEPAMAKLHESEAAGVNEINTVFMRRGIKLALSNKITGTDYSVDGCMKVLSDYLYVIAEFKNEAGSTTTEPYFQAISYYLESTKNLVHKYFRSTFPCLLVVLSGPYISFAGAAWNKRPTAQILSPGIPFHGHRSDTQNWDGIVRYLAALRRAIVALESYYTSLISEPQSPVEPVNQVFPYPTTYLSCDGTRTKFRYIKEADGKKLIYFATEDNSGDRICVKFTRKYSRDAHEYLASLGCAPALRGFEIIPAGWHLIVFDRLIGFETIYDRTKSLPSSVFEDMSGQFAKFHEAGFVHGDVRDVNIMVSKTDENKFKFIDFDWAGRIGEARYPARANHVDITQPHDALDGNPITREHVEFMLERIREVKDPNYKK